MLQDIKQSWQLIKANPVVSGISIAGTALSIAMIMVVVYQFQINFVGFAPETYRSRMLHFHTVSPVNNEGIISNTGFSFEMVKEVFYPIDLAENITAFTYLTSFTPSIKDKRVYREYHVRKTDASFWEVFNFTFLYGKPFTQVEFESGLPKVVITESLSRDLYGTENPVDKILIYGFKEYTITGVVKDVSRAASFAYSEVWLPYTSTEDARSFDGYYEGISGPLKVVTLAKNKKDFNSIWNEVLRNTSVYNTTKERFNVELRYPPRKRWEIALDIGGYSNKTVRDFILETGGILFFLLLVPALNLTGLTQAAVQQRASEIGVRKSFGADYKILVLQIINENMLISLIGGFIGLLLSLFFLAISKDFLFVGNTLTGLNMILTPFAFLFALLFIVILNLLSSLLPALRIARLSIVNAMKDCE